MTLFPELTSNLRVNGGAGATLEPLLATARTGTHTTETCDITSRDKTRRFKQVNRADQHPIDDASLDGERNWLKIKRNERAMKVIIDHLDEHGSTSQYDLAKVLVSWCGRLKWSTAVSLTSDSLCHLRVEGFVVSTGQKVPTDTCDRDCSLVWRMGD